MRTRTGVSIIAVIRGEAAIPAPGPEMLLLGGDIVVVVGLAEGIDSAARLLVGSEQ
jgi:TrkA domain protein